MPFKSKAQRRKFYAMADRGEISDDTVERWEDETPKGKKLPERVKKSLYVAGCQSAYTKLGADEDAGLKYLAMKHGPQGLSLLRPISGLWGGPGSSLTEKEQAFLQMLQQAQSGAEPGQTAQALAQTIAQYPQRSLHSQSATPDLAALLADVRRHTS